MKKDYLDEMNLLACFAVVVLHTNAVVHRFEKESWWISANIIENIFFFAVPLFFMISGAKLMDYKQRYSTMKFLKKRVLNVVFPFVFWSIVSYIYRLLLKGEYSDLKVNQFIEKLINAEYNVFYWFFLPFIMTSICFPIFSAISKVNRQRIFGYAIGLSFLFNSLLPLVLQAMGIFSNNAFNVPAMTGYMIYPLLGYYLMTYEISRPMRYLLYVLGVISIAVQTVWIQHIAYMIDSVDIGSVNPYLKSYLSVFTEIYTSAIFVFFKYKQNDFFPRFVKWVKPYIFGVFLIQYFIFDYINTYMGFNIYRLSYRLVAPFVIFGCALCITSILKKVPLLKYTV